MDKQSVKQIILFYLKFAQYPNFHGIRISQMKSVQV